MAKRVIPCILYECREAVEEKKTLSFFSEWNKTLEIKLLDVPIQKCINIKKKKIRDNSL